MAGDKYKDFVNNIVNSTNYSEYLEQALSNPINHYETNLKEIVPPNRLYQAKYYNIVESVTTLGNDAQGGCQFQINPSDPYKLNELLFKFRVEIGNLPTDWNKFEEKKTPYPMIVSDPFASLFKCVTISVGNNQYAIDNLGNQQAEWHYIYNCLEMTAPGRDTLWPITGMLTDTPGAYDLFGLRAVEGNLRGVQRRTGLIANPKANSFCIEGFYKPAHLLFEKPKIFPPGVPIRFNFQLNSVEAVIKWSKNNANAAFFDYNGTPTLTLTKAQCRFNTYKLNENAYDRDKNKILNASIKPDPLLLPSNPYKESIAQYDFLQVRSIEHVIPANTATYTLNLSGGRQILPKALVYVFSKNQIITQTNNQFEFPINFIDTINILVDGQPVVDCNLSKGHCNAPYQEFYMRLRNYLGANLSSKDDLITLREFENGMGINAELITPSNRINERDQMRIGNLSLKISLEPFGTPINIHVYLIYDQNLFIDDKGNAALLINV